MKNISLLLISIFIITASFAGNDNFIKEDWEKARKLSEKENKILFVDFYTDWCGWCTVMDKNTFQDSATAIFMNENFILLKVDAEKGVGVDLSKKYRLTAFPSFMFFSPDGKVIKKVMGYKDPKGFKEVMDEVLQLQKDGKTYEGISSSLKLDYPDFYVDDFKDRAERPKADLDAINKYLSKQKDITTEVNFCIIYRFTLNKENRTKFLDNIDTFRKLYGTEDVDSKLQRILYDIYRVAFEEKDEELLNQINEYIDKYMTKDKEKAKLNYRLNFYYSTQNWEKLCLVIDEKYKTDEMTNATLNQYSWNMYQKCDDLECIGKAINWMKKVIDEEPSYAYLDTYAALLYKKGNYEQAEEYALKSIEKGKEEGEKYEATEKLLEDIRMAIKKR